MNNRMFNSICPLALGSLVLLGLIAFGASNAHSWQGLKVSAHPAEAAPVDLPLSFEPNNGQSEDTVRFVARGPGYSLYLNEAGASIQFSRPLGVSAKQKQPVLALNLAGRKKTNPKLLGQDERPSKSSYFMGSDRKKWLTGIPNFSRVALRNVYDGVDVTYYGRHGELECEFRVSPHASPASLALKIEGANNLHLDTQGDLVFTAAQTEMRLQKPVAYQEGSDSRQTVAVRYILNKNKVTFGLGRYDASRALFIDPVLRYSGYLGLQDADATRQNDSRPSVLQKSDARLLPLTVPQGFRQLSKESLAFSGEELAPVTASTQCIRYQQGTRMLFPGPQIRERYLEREFHDTLS
jgi:hypothetical protein